MVYEYKVYCDSCGEFAYLDGFIGNMGWGKIYHEHDTFLSLEPLSEFDLETLVYMIVTINPIAVEIGLENYTNFTKKPSDASVELLLEELRQHNIHYILKENLRHLEETAN